MILRTRYRDVPWEEIIRCYKMPFRAHLSKSQWEQLRGKPVQVITPHESAVGFKCEGPFYRIANEGGNSVCPHIAEIGD